MFLVIGRLPWFVVFPAFHSSALVKYVPDAEIEKSVFFHTGSLLLIVMVKPDTKGLTVTSAVAADTGNEPY